MYGAGKRQGQAVNSTVLPGKETKPRLRPTSPETFSHCHRYRSEHHPSHIHREATCKPQPVSLHCERLPNQDIRLETPYSQLVVVVVKDYKIDDLAE